MRGFHTVFKIIFLVLCHITHSRHVHLYVRIVKIFNVYQKIKNLFRSLYNYVKYDE